ncbi:MAG: hypothetical protein M0024_10565 [Nitrospiraceae bacterium]|nr:hypothetical protein [Nitrospiraceae bacterium]
MEYISAQDVLRQLDNEDRLLRYPKPLTEEIAKTNSIDTTHEVTLLDMAVMKNDTRTAELILSDGCKRVVPALEIAVSNPGNAEMVDLICKNRHVSQNDKNCLLLQAVVLGEKDDVEVLLRHGAKPKEVVNSFSLGETVVETAKKKGFNDIAQMLESSMAKDLGKGNDR